MNTDMTFEERMDLRADLLIVKDEIENLLWPQAYDNRWWTLRFIIENVIDVLDYSMLAGVLRENGVGEPLWYTPNKSALDTAIDMADARYQEVLAAGELVSLLIVPWDRVRLIMLRLRIMQGDLMENLDVVLAHSRERRVDMIMGQPTSS